MKHTIRLITVGLSIGVLFVLSLVIVLAYQWPELIKQYPIPANSSNNAAQQMDTSDWLTYDTKVGGVTFKHPSDFLIDPPLPTVQEADLRLITIRNREWPSRSQLVSITINKYGYNPEGTILDIPQAYILGERILPTDSLNDVEKKINSFARMKVSSHMYPEGIVVVPSTIQRQDVKSGVVWYFKWANKTDSVREYPDAFLMIINQTDVVITGTSWGVSLDKELRNIIQSFSQ